MIAGILGGCQARADEQGGQRIDVIAERLPAHQSGLEWGGAPTHEGVVDPLPRRGQARDEEGGHLRLEAGPVADLVERMRLTLRRRPERVDEVCDPTLLECAGGLAELAEGADAIQEFLSRLPVRSWRERKRERRQGSVGNRSGDLLPIEAAQNGRMNNIQALKLNGFHYQSSIIS